MSAGGSVASSDTRFSRNGTVDTSSWRDLTDNQRQRFGSVFAQLDDHASNKTVGPLASQQMNRGWDDVPYTNALCDIIRSNMPENKVPGQASLQAQSQVNPYSSEYADNTFNRYADETQRAMATARSGPMATRGGTAAQGFMQSDALNQMALNREDVLTKNRQADSGIQQGASGALAGERAQMNQTALGGINSGFGGFYNLIDSQQKAGHMVSERTKLYSDLLPTYTSLATPMKGREENALEGRGAQSSSSMGAGVNLCCFIFLEAYNGALPDSVRAYRDMAAPESSARREGYIRMSKWLVPAMRVSGVARKLTNCLLVRPLTKYGEWFYGKNKTGWVFYPVKQAWFAIWTLTAK